MLTRSEADAMVVMNEMRLMHPAAEAIFRKLDVIREVKRRSRQGTAQQLAVLVGPTQIGKSTIFEMYLRTVVAPYCIQIGLFKPGTDVDYILERQRVVVYVSLSEKSSLTKLAIDFLSKGFKDPLADNGKNPAAKLFRVAMLLADHNTELIIIDELGNLGSTLSSGITSGTDSNTVQNHFRNRIIEGYPVVFAGVPKSDRKIISDLQLKGRDLKRLDYAPLSLQSEGDRRIFYNFLHDMSEHLKAMGICDELMDFESETPPRFMLACNGQLGSSTRTIRKVLEFAIEDGAKRPMIEHYRKAVDEYCLPNKLCKFNPFVPGKLPSRMVLAAD